MRHYGHNNLTGLYCHIRSACHRQATIAGLQITLVVDTVSIPDQNSVNTLLYPRSARVPLPFRVDPNYSTLGLGRGSDTWARVLGDIFWHAQPPWPDYPDN